MMNTAPHDDDPAAEEELTTARLLRMAEARPGVPADREARVRRAVRDEWRALARRRRRRGWMVLGSVAAAAAALTVQIADRRTPGPSHPVPAEHGVVATVERAEGQVTRAAPAAAQASAVRLARDSRLMDGDVVRTGRGSRAAIRLVGGASLRLDNDTELRLASATAIELSAGAVYVDSGPDGRTHGLEVRTPLGFARDVGTQFLVQLSPANLRILVRSGAVELRHAGQSTQARARTALLLAGNSVTTQPVRPYGAEWDWASALAPSVPLEGRMLGAFLRDLARERGWTVQYADAAIARRAETAILHGSVEGLEATEALDVVTESSGLAYRLRDGVLDVTLPPISRPPGR